MLRHRPGTRGNAYVAATPSGLLPHHECVVPRGGRQRRHLRRNRRDEPVHRLRLHPSAPFPLRNAYAAGAPDLTIISGMRRHPRRGDWSGGGRRRHDLLLPPPAGQFLLLVSAMSHVTLGRRGFALGGHWNGDGIDSFGVFPPRSRVLSQHERTRHSIDSLPVRPNGDLPPRRLGRKLH